MNPTTTTPASQEAKAQAAIQQVAQMIASRLQSRDPLTQAEGYRLLTACPFAEDAVNQILKENQ
jgi:hypothetical protein